MSVDIRKINWRKNPVQAQEDIEHNFNVLNNAFNSLVNGILQKAKISKLSADTIFSGFTDIKDIFASKKAEKLIEGNNINIAYEKDGIVLNTSKKPSFEKIYSGDTDISSIFISRKDINDTTRPQLGRNLIYAKNKGGLILEMLEKPHFESFTSNAMSATSACFDSIIYQGRLLDEYLPSYKLPESAPYLVLKKIDWGSNPSATRADINENYSLISKAFNSLLQHKLNDVQINRITVHELVLSGVNINDLYLSKNADYDIVRIQTGENIVTGGTQNRPIIGVVKKPIFEALTANTVSFEEIILDNQNILNVFYTRKEAASLTHPELGDNLQLSNEKKPRISVVSNPKFSTTVVRNITADTISVKNILYNDFPIENLFGSHTFITAGKNVFTAGTPHDPVISIIDDPIFASISSNKAIITSLTADTIASKSATFDNATFSNSMNVSGALLVDGNNVTLANNLYLHDDHITIGGEPELDISSFLRTKIRILATQSSPIHYALIIQKKEHEHKRVLNDDTVDFVVRGDGNVGIGAFVDITSKLTVKSENGFDQLRLSNPFSPEETSDKTGSIGNIAWDDYHFYVKTSMGWKRARLDIF